MQKYSAKLKSQSLGEKDVESTIAIVSARDEATLCDPIFAKTRLLSALATAFGLLALALGALGLYGVIGYRVTRRTREFGIRTALGADATQILGIVLKEVAAIVGTGIAIGVPPALVMLKYVGTLLYGLKPNDASVLKGSAAVLSFVGLLAGLIPAVRAARIDPMSALRVD